MRLVTKFMLFELFSALLFINGLECHDGKPLPNPLPGTNTYELRMPGAVVEKDDAYLCTAFKLDSNASYITGFRVEGTAERAHHMMLIGCRDVPLKAKENGYWDCGSHRTCSGGRTVLFAWANNAPGLNLPPSVGFRIGGPESESRSQYLVLQVHYAKKLPKTVLDYSAISLEITKQRQRYEAGILLMVGQPTIPPYQLKYNSDACCLVNVPSKLNVIAARVHAHSLGVVISGYKLNSKTGETTKIIKGNPQWPQAFFPTEKLTLETGDDLLVRCTYSSLNRNRTTYTGATGADEMCNLYIMYYTEQHPGPMFEQCGHICNEPQVAAYPADSDVALPRNPILEAYALHGAHHASAQLDTIKFDSFAQNPVHWQHQNIETATGSSQAPPSTTTTTSTTTKPAPPPPEVENVKNHQQQIADQMKKDEENFWNLLWFYNRFSYF